MADEFLGLLPDSGDVTLTQSGGTLTRRYLVYLESAEASEVDALSVSGVPSGFIDLADIPGAKLRQKSGKRRDGSAHLWEVTCEYSTPETNDGTTTQEAEDPTDSTPTLSHDWQEAEEIVYGERAEEDRQYAGALRNAAGEPFDPPLMRKVWRTQFTITRFYTNDTATFVTALGYQGTVNNDTFLGLGANEVMCTYVKPVHERIDDTTYLKIAYTFLHNPDSWDLQVLEQGNYYLDDEENKVAFKTEDGHPFKGLLTETGGKLADDAEPVYAEKQVYTSKTFGSLGLPTSLSGYKLV